MSNTIDSNTTAAKEYRWRDIDIHSYSFAASDSAWNYSTEPSNSNVDSDGAYLFSDSPTGQPFARRGNLYNWTTATLGSSLKLENYGQAQDSICPRGWKLPNYSGANSFEGLLNTYNITEDESGRNRMAEWPLQYLPTGSYSSASGFIVSRTGIGVWWMGTGYNDEADDLWLSANSASTEGTAPGNGYALRCGAHFSRRPTSIVVLLLPPKSILRCRQLLLMTALPPPKLTLLAKNTAGKVMALTAFAPLAIIALISLGTMPSKAVLIVALALIPSPIPPLVNPSLVVVISITGLPQRSGLYSAKLAVRLLTLFAHVVGNYQRAIGLLTNPSLNYSPIPIASKVA